MRLLEAFWWVVSELYLFSLLGSDKLVGWLVMGDDLFGDKQFLKMGRLD